MSALSKSTPSQDGRRRFDITVKHRVGVDELVAVIALTFWDERECDNTYTDPDKGERLDRRRITKASVTAALREQLAMNADKLNWWTDDIDDQEDDVDEVSAWALEHVLRLWPELNTN